MAGMADPLCCFYGHDDRKLVQWMRCKAWFLIGAGSLLPSGLSPSVRPEPKWKGFIPGWRVDHCWMRKTGRLSAEQVLQASVNFEVA